MIEAVVLQRIYIDTNIFIGAFETSDQTSQKLRLLFKKLEARPNRAVTSELTLAELLVRDGASRAFYLGLIVSRGFIDLILVSHDILIETGSHRAALIRSGRKMKLPDAIHIVSAIKTQCDFMFSADSRLSLPHAVQLVSPSEAGFEISNKALDV